MLRKYRPFNPDQYAGWYGYRDFSLDPHSQLMVHLLIWSTTLWGRSIPSMSSPWDGLVPIFETNG